LQVHSIALSPELSNERSSQLLAIGLDGGKVEIHQVRNESFLMDIENYKNNIGFFSS